MRYCISTSNSCLAKSDWPRVANDHQCHYFRSFNLNMKLCCGHREEPPYEYNDKFNLGPVANFNLEFQKSKI